MFVTNLNRIFPGFIFYFSDVESFSNYSFQDDYTMSLWKPTYLTKNRKRWNIIKYEIGTVDTILSDFYLPNNKLINHSQ